MSLDMFVGQNSTKQVLSVSISGFQKFGGSFPTYLLDWPPGHGKNTLHRLIAGELGIKAVTFTSSDGIKRLGQLLHENSRHDALLLIDEAHVIKARKLVEPLLILLEERTFVHPNGIQMEYPRMSFMLATTQGWALPNDIRSRIRATLPLDEYSDEDIARIIQSFVSVDLDSSVLQDLISLALGEPRIARGIAETINIRLRQDLSIDRSSICQDLGLTLEGMTKEESVILDFIRSNYRNGPGSASSNDIAGFTRNPIQAVPRIMARLVRLGKVFQDSNYIWNLRQGEN